MAQSAFDAPFNKNHAMMLSSTYPTIMIIFSLNAATIIRPEMINNKAIRSNFNQQAPKFSAVDTDERTNTRETFTPSCDKGVLSLYFQLDV